MSNPTELAHELRAFLKRAAKAQDADAPLKGLEEALNEVIADGMVYLAAVGFIKVDDTSDFINVTTGGRAFAGLALDDVPDTSPGRLAEIKGSISETELAARYLEGKAAGAEKVARENGDLRDNALWLARCFIGAAEEYRQGMHIPSIVIDGKVKPYNDDNETGVKHAANLALFFTDVHERNCRAGWWSDLETGEPLKRNVGELLMLFVTEIVEAYDAYLEGAADDKLPDHPGLGVEIGDLAIRMADFAGAAMAGKLVAYSGANNPGDDLFAEVGEIAHQYEKIRKTPEAKGDPETGQPIPPMDIPLMIDAKLAYNAERKDHKVEERLKDGGKKT